MNILFLGPSCPRLEKYLRTLGHAVCREEYPFSPDFLRRHSFDFGLSYRYRHILPAEEVRYFEGRILNLHISLLPWNRGSDPNLWSFLENTPKGVTIHQLSEGLDTGDVVLQREVRLDEAKETLRTSYVMLSETVERLFMKNGEALLAEKIHPHPQPPGGSFHRCRDKTPYLPLLKKKGWDTPVREVVGKGLRERINYVLS